MSQERFELSLNRFLTYCLCRWATATNTGDRSRTCTSLWTTASKAVAAPNYATPANSRFYSLKSGIRYAETSKVSTAILTFKLSTLAPIGLKDLNLSFCSCASRGLSRLYLATPQRAGTLIFRNNPILHFLHYHFCK